MFKEALAGVLVLSLFYGIYRFLRRKRMKAAAVLAGALLLFSIFANIIYNSIVMFPDFYMDTVTGPYRYGTFSENLFAYSDEFMFQDNILFPVLKNRTVLLDARAGFYQKFFSLYSASCQQEEVPAANMEAVLAHKEDFSFSHEFSCIGIMDYVTDGIPAQLTADFEEERYPFIFINIASLKGEPALRILMDEDYTLYIMSEAYYQTITGGISHV